MPASPPDHVGLPPLPDRQAPLPAVEITPAQRATGVLSRPAATMGLGARPASARKVATFWQKTAYVLVPVIVTPAAVGVAAMGGFLVMGAALGALAPGLTTMGGLAAGAVIGGPTAASAMGILQAVGLLQAIGRIRSSRKEVWEVLEARRHKKASKSKPGTAKHSIYAPIPRR